MQGPQPRRPTLSRRSSASRTAAHTRATLPPAAAPASASCSPCCPCAASGTSTPAGSVLGGASGSAAAYSPPGAAVEASARADSRSASSWSSDTWKKESGRHAALSLLKTEHASVAPSGGSCMVRHGDQYHHRPLPVPPPTPCRYCLPPAPQTRPPAPGSEASGSPPEHSGPAGWWRPAARRLQQVRPPLGFGDAAREGRTVRLASTQPCVPILGCSCTAPRKRPIQAFKKSHPQSRRRPARRRRPAAPAHGVVPPPGSRGASAVPPGRRLRRAGARAGRAS